MIVICFQKLTQRLMVNKHVFLICIAKFSMKTTGNRWNSQFIILLAFLFPVVYPWVRNYISIKEYWETPLRTRKITDCSRYPWFPGLVPGFVPHTSSESQWTNYSLLKIFSLVSLFFEQYIYTYTKWISNSTDGWDYKEKTGR